MLSGVMQCPLDWSRASILVDHVRVGGAQDNISNVVRLSSFLKASTTRKSDTQFPLDSCDFTAFILSDFGIKMEATKEASCTIQDHGPGQRKTPVPSYLSSPSSDATSNRIPTPTFR